MRPAGRYRYDVIVNFQLARYSGCFTPVNAESIRRSNTIDHKIMRSVLKQFAAITRLTALEASRQPIFLLLSTVVLVFIALLPVLITHVIGDSSRMVRDSALAIQLVTGLILGCYAATATITRELRRGTLASILSKPVGRTLFFLAKFTGVSLIMLSYTVIATIAAMLSVRTAAVPFTFDAWGSGPILVAVLLAYGWSALQNYFVGTPFVSRTYLTLFLAVLGALLVSSLIPAEGGEGFGSAISWSIVPAGALLGLAMMLLSAFAVTLATRLELTPTFTICLVALLLGLMSDYLFGQRADEYLLFRLLYAITPNWQHFWAVDALQRAGIPWSYTGGVAAYTGFYAAAVLSGGLLLFHRMEVK